MHSIVTHDLVYFAAAALFSMDSKTPVRKSISNDDDTMVSQGTCMKSARVHTLTLRRSTHHDAQSGSVVNLCYMYGTT